MKYAKRTNSFCCLAVMVLVFFGSTQSEADNPDQRTELPQRQKSFLDNAPRAVFAHVMVQFRSKAHSGKWLGWNRLTEDFSAYWADWSKMKHDPNKLDERGRPDIPSVFYPLVGLYDMTDSDAIEYHCQLARMSGIDGFIFDLHTYNEEGPESESWKPQCMRLYANIMARYDLKAIICYEDSYNFVANPKKTRQEIIHAAYADMDAWLSLFNNIQYRIDKRPLVFLFSYELACVNKKNGVSKLLPSELEAWKMEFANDDRPIIANQYLKPEYSMVIDGEFDWIYMGATTSETAPLIRFADMNDVKKRRYDKSIQMRDWLKQGLVKFPISGVWPGFNDFKVWGWGSGPSLMSRLDGQIYTYLWQEAIREDYPLVQIATWNDWCESSIIEPTVEFEVKYLDITRQYAAKFKKSESAKGDLCLPVWIYKVRKITRDKQAINDMKRASELIRAGQAIKAEAIVKPWVDKLKVDETKYWIDKTEK